MDADTLKALRLLELQARVVERRENAHAHGAFSSELDQYLDEKIRSVRPRADIPPVEITEHITLFIRSLFAQHATVTWYGDGAGHTDVAKSAIVIESQFADNQNRQFDFQKPTITVRPGPTSTVQLSQGNLKHWNPITGAKTFTTLEPGTIQALVHHTTAASALELAHFVKNAMLACDDNLRYRTLHAVQNIAIGGYDADNPSYNRTSDKQSHVVIPITFTYYYQTTYRTQPRQGVYEMAQALMHTFSVVETPSAAVDARTDSVVQLGDSWVVVPIDPDSE